MGFQNLLVFSSSKFRLFSRIINYKIKSNNILKMSTTNFNNNDLFTENRDRFNGVTINSTTECILENDDFSKKLILSLEKWKRQNVRTVWFNISLKYSTWIPILVENNFIFHHASFDGKMITMFSWLPKNEPCNIPAYSHTLIGVGAIVINPKNEILTVSEKFHNNWWKLPGGFLEPKEDIDAAAEREVFEETGIKTKFQNLILLRHTLDSKFECSDIYFICKLSPLSYDISKCQNEIADARWVDIQEFLNNSNVHELNKRFINTYLNCQKNQIGLIKETGLHPILKKPYTLYNVHSGI